MAEAAQCAVAAAGIAMQYLVALPQIAAPAGEQPGARLRRAWDQRHVDSLRRICPEVPEVGPGLLRAARLQATTKRKKRRSVVNLDDTASDSTGSSASGRNGEMRGKDGEEEYCVLLGRVAGYSKVSEDYVAELLQEASELFAGAGLHCLSVEVSSTGGGSGGEKTEAQDG